jgi:hypothetical protein
MKRTPCAVLALVGAMVAAPLAHDPGGADSIASFRPIATFNVPGATSAEIVAASRDGRRADLPPRLKVSTVRTACNVRG